MLDQTVLPAACVLRVCADNESVLRYVQSHYNLLVSTKNAQRGHAHDSETLVCPYARQWLAYWWVRQPDKLPVECPPPVNLLSATVRPNTQLLHRMKKQNVRV